jgi:hypothetical protein
MNGNEGLKLEISRNKFRQKKIRIEMRFLINVNTLILGRAYLTRRQGCMAREPNLASQKQVLVSFMFC